MRTRYGTSRSTPPSRPGPGRRFTTTASGSAASPASARPRKHRTYADHMCPHIPDDPYGRTVDYPADVDTAWQRLRRVVAGQPTPVLEALRDTAEQWVGSAEGDGAPTAWCVTTPRWCCASWRRSSTP